MASLTLQDKAAVKQAVENLYHRASVTLKRSFPLPSITFRRSGKNAGTAFLNQNRINFHPLFFSENRQAYFDEVIPHEISHLLVYQLYGRVKPHGVEWQTMMSQVFGVEPSTTHQFDLSSLNIKTFRYLCDCDEIRLSVRRHNKVLRGQQYRCRRCQAILRSAE